MVSEPTPDPYWGDLWGRGKIANGAQGQTLTEGAKHVVSEQNNLREIYSEQQQSGVQMESPPLAIQPKDGLQYLT
jgi:hypothetical protein